MERLARSISKMFVILVLLLGSPPVVSLRNLVRRPRVALVAPPPPGFGADPFAPPADETPRPAPERTYIRVDAA
jgi:hypothetical protein